MSVDSQPGRDDGLSLMRRVVKSLFKLPQKQNQEAATGLDNLQPPNIPLADDFLTNMAELITIPPRTRGNFRSQVQVSTEPENKAEMRTENPQINEEPEGTDNTWATQVNSFKQEWPSILESYGVEEKLTFIRDKVLGGGEIVKVPYGLGLVYPSMRLHGWGALRKDKRYFGSPSGSTIDYSMPEKYGGAGRRIILGGGVSSWPLVTYSSYALQLFTYELVVEILAQKYANPDAGPKQIPTLIPGYNVRYDGAPSDTFIWYSKYYRWGQGGPSDIESWDSKPYLWNNKGWEPFTTRGTPYQIIEFDLNKYEVRYPNSGRPELKPKDQELGLAKQLAGIVNGNRVGAPAWTKILEIEESTMRRVQSAIAAKEVGSFYGSLPKALSDLDFTLSPEQTAVSRGDSLWKLRESGDLTRPEFARQIEVDPMILKFVELGMIDPTGLIPDFWDRVSRV